MYHCGISKQKLYWSLSLSERPRLAFNASIVVMAPPGLGIVENDNPVLVSTSCKVGTKIAGIRPLPYRYITVEDVGAVISFSFSFTFGIEMAGAVTTECIATPQHI